MGQIQDTAPNGVKYKQLGKAKKLGSFEIQFICPSGKSRCHIEDVAHMMQYDGLFDGLNFKD